MPLAGELYSMSAEQYRMYARMSARPLTRPERELRESEYLASIRASKPREWVMSDYTVVHMSKMSSTHLRSTIRMLEVRYMFNHRSRCIAHQERGDVMIKKYRVLLREERRRRG